MKITPLHIISETDKRDGTLNAILYSLSCGFPSPADDYLENLPSLDSLLIKHPSTTYIARASGESMIERGILDGSIVIVDRSIRAKHNLTIVASIGGELTIKILDEHNKKLMPANRKQAPILLPDELDVICEGVVTYVISAQSGFEIFPT